MQQLFPCIKKLTTVLSSCSPTSMRADHWKSLGPMNMLDLTYLDEDLRVMRGCTSSDTVFIWKRKL